MIDQLSKFYVEEIDVLKYKEPDQHKCEVYHK